MLRHNLTKHESRKRRVRAKMTGTAAKPRLTVYRSNKHLYLQAIDDEGQRTIASASDSAKKTGTKSESAAAVAKAIAQVLKTKKVASLIFDRGHYRYHGRVKAVAEALREQGLHV